MEKLNLQHFGRHNQEKDLPANSMRKNMLENILYKLDVQAQYRQKQNT